MEYVKEILINLHIIDDTILGVDKETFEYGMLIFAGLLIMLLVFRLLLKPKSL